MPFELHEQGLHVLLNASSCRDAAAIAAAVESGAVHTLSAVASAAHAAGRAGALALAFGVLTHLIEHCAEGATRFCGAGGRDCGRGSTAEGVPLLLTLCEPASSLGGYPEVRVSAAELLLTLCAVAPPPARGALVRIGARRALGSLSSGGMSEAIAARAAQAAQELPD